MRLLPLTFGTAGCDVGRSRFQRRASSEELESAVRSIERHGTVLQDSVTPGLRTVMQGSVTATLSQSNGILHHLQGGMVLPRTQRPAPIHR
jgi:hypothetical protein